MQAAFVAKAELAEGIRKGQRVSMRKSGAKATVSYIGPVSELEGDGIWLGVTFDDATGEHDGSLSGKRYFECASSHGSFVEQLILQLSCLC